MVGECARGRKTVRVAYSALQGRVWCEDGIREMFGNARGGVLGGVRTRPEKLDGKCSHRGGCMAWRAWGGRERCSGMRCSSQRIAHTPRGGGTHAAGKLALWHCEICANRYAMRAVHTHTAHVLRTVACAARYMRV